MPRSAPSACRPRSSHKDGSEEKKKESGSTFCRCWRLQTALGRVFSRAGCMEAHSKHAQNRPAVGVPCSGRSSRVSTYKSTRKTRLHTHASQGLAGGGGMLCPHSQQFIFCSAASCRDPQADRRPPSPPAAGRTPARFPPAICCGRPACGWTAVAGRTVLTKALS